MTGDEMDPVIEPIGDVEALCILILSGLLGIVMIRAWMAGRKTDE